MLTYNCLLLNGNTYLRVCFVRSFVKLVSLGINSFVELSSLAEDRLCSSHFRKVCGGNQFIVILLSFFVCE